MIAAWIVGAVLIIAGMFCGIYWDEIPWERLKRTEKPKPGPEVGTIRIVEKMDKAGTVYYTAEWFHATHGWWRWRTPDSDPIHEDTPEEAQQEANDEEDRCRVAAEEKAELRRRAEHHKVMGEFKP